MESTKNEVEFELPSYFRAFKDGRVERLFDTDRVPPSTHSDSSVSSKDILISPETTVSARLFKPTTNPQPQKLPLLIYFHGGAFCYGSAFCATYHNHLTSLVAEANVIAVSVEYRLAPEHPVPVAYEDSWAALKWVASHCDGQGPEPWLNDCADLRRVFVAGDSAGGNIAHNMAVQAAVEPEDLAGMRLLGACLINPGFANKHGDFHELWHFVYPTTTGADDPRINPAVDPRLSRLACSRVLVCVAENDRARDGGLFYYESLGKSGWGGVLEILDSPNEGHVFHLVNPTCENAVILLKKIASFLNQV
ncbi:hypothetical protein ACSBR1_019840 [Camellia fascicularis]